jgi:type VI secretion system protein ImpF
MASTESDRLQPSLLDRLTDDARERKEESRDGRVLSMRRIRQCVIRDIETLFNCPAPSEDQEYADFPEVANSVVNYGIPGLAGTYASNLDLDVLERRVRQAIWDFEPRLSRSSVKVRAHGDTDEFGVTALAFSIDAELWSYPQPERISLIAKVAHESGRVMVRERSGRGD